MCTPPSSSSWHPLYIVGSEVKEMANQNQRSSFEESYVIAERPVSREHSETEAPSCQRGAADVEALLQQITLLEEQKLQFMAENADQSSRIAELESSQEALKRQCAELQRSRVESISCDCISAPEPTSFSSGIDSAPYETGEQHRIYQCPRNDLALHAMEDINSLCNAISSNRMSGPLDLRGAVIPKPVASTTNGTRRSVKMWPQQAEINWTNVHRGLYSLSEAPSSDAIVCVVTNASTEVHSGTMELDKDAALMFDATCSDVHLKDVIFKEGIIVCCGIGCMVSFTNVHFGRSTLVVLGGAEANLQACAFAHEVNSPNGISVLAHGTETSVQMNGGSITGGAIGVSALSGATVSLSDVACSKISVSGVECQGHRSHVAITSSTFEDFSQCCSYTSPTHAIHAHGSSKMQLRDVSIKGQGMDFGVLVHTLASASLSDCTIEETRKSGVEFRAGSSGHLQGCKISRSKEHGLHVSGRDSTAEAVSCVIAENGSSGACASRHSKLQLQSCDSKHNEGTGGYVVTAGASIKLIECASFADTVGFHAYGTYAALTAHSCQVSSGVKALVEVLQGARAELDSCTLQKSSKEGVLVESASTWVCMEGCTVSEVLGSCMLVRKAAKAALQWCTLANSTAWHGLDAQDSGTEVHLDQCLLRNNKQCGLSCSLQATGAAIGCRSIGNEGSGYSAMTHSRMTMVQCSSDENTRASVADEGGVIVKEKLWVNGVVEK